MTNKNFKAAPASPEESARIQQYWMDNFGAKWWDEADNIIKLTDRTYLYLEEGMIDWGGRQERYNDKNLPIFSLPDKKEITIDDLEIGMEVMLKPYDQVRSPYFYNRDYFNKRVEIEIISKHGHSFRAVSGSWYHISSIDHIIKNDNKMKESRFPFKLSEDQFKKGLKLCCGRLKQELIEKHGLSIVERGYTYIGRDEYRDIRSQAEYQNQSDFLDELFGKDEPDVPKIKKGTPIWARHCSNLWWVYGKFHSFEEGKACLITIYDTKSNQFDDYSLTPPVL